ncbi:MAG: phosphoribosylaminoimidazolesuccinocarboxamide synthase, partial [Candidatus Dadabacteria bacterium]|nr:phosphoribosylaminoimidazolesuccinocarboxamide synthase [Candidatus Dadabacteria bacterium]
SRVRDASIEIYTAAAGIAEERGIIIADTKFEFGIDRDTGELILIDEALTPDSSRFWPRADYAPGGPQTSFDKQFVRDYLKQTGWNRNPPAPELPPDIVRKTSEKYLEMLRLFCGG